MKKSLKYYLVATVVAAVSSFSFAENLAQNTDKTEIETVARSIGGILKSNYVFPEQGDKMNALLEQNLRSGKYYDISRAQQLAQVLTEDLQSINQDLHLRVMFRPETVAEIRKQQSEGSEGELLPSELKSGQRDNYGFKEVKILPGNIGYLKLDSFYDTTLGGETAVAAMNYLSNSDALIVDLRDNGGGSPSMIQLITSYFYDEPVLLNSFYNRPEDETTQSWTLPHVPGKRRPDIELYVLTSKRTFSAAEEFSYNLKHLKRATLIGETTGGGAHPGGTEIASDRFLVWVPSGRSINPVTKSNWEGVGVKPDIEVDQEQALATARKLALETLVKNSNQDKNREDSVYYQWHLDTVKAKLSPVAVPAEVLLSYAGNFGPRKLTVKDGVLFYQRDKGPKNELQALAQDLFVIPGVDYFRLKVVVEDGKVTALKGLYDNGRTDINYKES
ncbi:S41 family peptidase [Thalassomonas viridans]|uniref:S41 family peptidase n=1 Tax=Thalassomonas viridans TaxID=137584 RepID=A0AAE9Z468_9GAMM|nr:S41 family peptidase [Thalassomonas viridans]WDE06446.1 S41 family peptidase [Thalassomonas viridans]